MIGLFYCIVCHSYELKFPALIIPSSSWYSTGARHSLVNHPLVLITSKWLWCYLIQVPEHPPHSDLLTGYDDEITNLVSKHTNGGLARESLMGWIGMGHPDSPAYTQMNSIIVSTPVSLLLFSGCTQYAPTSQTTVTVYTLNSTAHPLYKV